MTLIFALLPCTFNINTPSVSHHHYAYQIMITHLYSPFELPAKKDLLFWNKTKILTRQRRCILKLTELI